MPFKISELSLRDTVNMADGAKLGPVKDVHIDLETGKVLSLVLSGGRKYFGFLSAGKDVEVPWEKVKKIGIHTVLVEIE
ncbi:MAG: PRC-barrel domain protein [Pelotomaculum sp. PtaU1.Bin035]|nr:MAG: PRC-barrel domain protein [Pelotomaculum sp. PtaU1.Bin035]